MATVVIMIGKGGAFGQGSAAPVWQGFPRYTASVTSAASAASLSSQTAERGDVVRVKADGGAVWVRDDGSDAAADAINSVYLADGDAVDVQYREGHTAGWSVIDA